VPVAHLGWRPSRPLNPLGKIHQLDFVLDANFHDRHLSCPLWLECAEWSYPEACEMLNTSGAAQKAAVTESRNCAGLLLGVIAAPNGEAIVSETGLLAPAGVTQREEVSGQRSVIRISISWPLFRVIF
jgi:hypothetical protein